MQTTRILDSIEARLQHQASVLHLSDEQTERARSLAVAGTVGALLGITPAELYALISLGYEHWKATQHPDVVTVDGEVQR